MIAPESNPPSRLLQYLLLTWVGASALFFLLRFSLTFHHANRSAIEGLVERLFAG